MIPSIERLKQAPSRLPRSLSYLTDLPNLYGDFISKNASSVSQIESALRSLTYIIPGRFRESELASESLHSFVQVLSLYHDSLLARAISRLPPAATAAGRWTGIHKPHPAAGAAPPPPTPHNRYTRFWTQTSPTYKRIALMLQMIQYTELLCEMVAKRRSERARWRVVVLLEIIKATCRLFLLRLTKSRPLLTSPLPERDVDPAALEESIQRLEKESSGMNGHVLSGQHQRSPSPPRKEGPEEDEGEEEEEASPATQAWTMPRTGMTLPSLPSLSTGANTETMTYLLSHALKAEDISPPASLLPHLSTLPSLLGEILYILRPVIYALALQHCHHHHHQQHQPSSRPRSSNKWFPFLLGLSIEYAAYKLSTSTSTTSSLSLSSSSSSKRHVYHPHHSHSRRSNNTSLENEELHRRERAMLWWVMRAPLYENVTGVWVRGLMNRLKGKPLLGLLAGVLEDYDWLWTEWYFSTATM